MKHNRPLFKPNEMDRRSPGLFAIKPIIPHILIIALVFGIYSYLVAEEFFPLWIHYIYYGVKIIIGLEIIRAGAKSLTGPLLAAALGGINLYLLQTCGLEYISADDSWQLIVISAIAMFLTFIVRSLKR